MNELMNNACLLMTAEAMWEYAPAETAPESDPRQTEDDIPLFI